VGQPEHLQANGEEAGVGVALNIAFGLKVLQQNREAALGNAQTLSDGGVVASVGVSTDELQNFEDTQRGFGHLSGLSGKSEGRKGDEPRIALPEAGRGSCVWGRTLGDRRVVSSIKENGTYELDNDGSILGITASS